MFMDVEEAIMKRRSKRKYMDCPVEWEKMGRIFEAGRAAPSSGNLQNWKFILSTDKQQRHQIAEACLQQWWMETAPVLLTVVAEPEKAGQHYGVRGERLYSIQNCAIAAAFMMLTAESLGLSTCFVAAFEEDRLKAILGCPEFARPQCVITIGYSDERVPELQKYKLENLVYFGKYANRIKDINATAGYTADKVLAAIGKGKDFIKGLAKPPQK